MPWTEADDVRIREFCKTVDVGALTECPKCVEEIGGKSEMMLSHFCTHKYCPFREWKQAKKAGDRATELNREQALAIHGPLVVRIADRMMQFRFGRSKALIASKFEGDCPDELSRYAEASALLAIVRAHQGMTGVDAYGDAGEGERLYGLKAGHVLTEQDVKDLECLMADHNDAIGFEAEKWHQARIATLREIGGDALVAAAEARDEQVINASVEKAMAKFRQMTEAGAA